MVRVQNDFEFWGDYEDDEIRERHLVVGRECEHDKYFYNYQKKKRVEDCQFCGDKIEIEFNRFDIFLRNNDIFNHTNHFESSLAAWPPKYHIDADVTPCWCNNMPQFSRSSVGGSKYLLSAQPYALDNDDLIFESRFESGNLARVVKVTQNYYELYLRPDMYTNRHTQWFYFRVKNTRAKMQYR
jgi:Cytosolic carboxypeptidase N-terminal domain